MGSRLELQTLLETIVDHVYFQPPSSVEMEYPCIVYSRTGRTGLTKFADNIPYSVRKAYVLTYIDPDPDSTILDSISQIPTCLLDRTFAVDNLNHYVFNIIF